jgi:hypothetical protein
MKKVIAILVLLLATGAIGYTPPADKLPPMVGPPPAEARILTVLEGGGVAVGCVTPAGNILREGFASTPDNTWTKPITADGHAVTYGHSLTAGYPDGSCADGLNITFSSTQNRERIYWDNGSGLAKTNNTTIEFSVRFTSFVMGDDESAYVFGWSTSNEGASGQRAQLLRTGDAYTIRWQGDASSAYVTIALDTWYYFKIYLDGATAANSYLRIVGGESTTCDADAECKFTPDDIDGRYFIIGKNGSNVQYANMEIGYVTINSVAP